MSWWFRRMQIVCGTCGAWGRMRWLYGDRTTGSRSSAFCVNWCLQLHQRGESVLISVLWNSDLYLSYIREITALQSAESKAMPLKGVFARSRFNIPVWGFTLNVNIDQTSDRLEEQKSCLLFLHLTTAELYHVLFWDTSCNYCVEWRPYVSEWYHSVNNDQIISIQTHAGPTAKSIHNLPPKEEPNSRALAT